MAPASAVAIRPPVRATALLKPDAMPLRRLLGKAALAGARSKIEALKADFDAWADVTEGADFPEGEG